MVTGRRTPYGHRRPLDSLSLSLGREELRSISQAAIQGAYVVLNDEAKRKSYDARCERERGEGLSVPFANWVLGLAISDAVGGYSTPP